MLSSNNWKELINKQEPKKQRFTIKKLTVGVASVLIGFTFMGASALADDNVTTNNSQNAVTNTAVTGTNNANAQETTATTDNNANSTATASNDAATTNTLNVQQALILMPLLYKKIRMKLATRKAKQKLITMRTLFLH